MVWECEIFDSGGRSGTWGIIAILWVLEGLSTDPLVCSLQGAVTSMEADQAKIKGLLDAAQKHQREQVDASKEREADLFVKVGLVPPFRRLIRNNNPSFVKRKLPTIP